MLRRSFMLKLLSVTAAVAGGAVTALRAAVNSVARYGMGIQIDKCIGCGRCVEACKEENDVPPEPFYFRTWVERYVIRKSGVTVSRHRHPDCAVPRDACDR